MNTARNSSIPTIVTTAAVLAVLALALAPLCGTSGVLFGGYELMTSSIEGELAIGVMAALVLADHALRQHAQNKLPPLNP